MNSMIIIIMMMIITTIMITIKIKKNVLDRLRA